MASEYKLLVDTNVLLDYAVVTRPEHTIAAQLFESAAACPNVALMVLVSSLKDAYYIMCRAYGSEATARDVLKRVSETLLMVVDLLAVYGMKAFVSDEPDFEDGLVRAAAESLGVTAIVKRDEAAFLGSSIEVMRPKEATAFIERLGS